MIVLVCGGRKYDNYKAVNQRLSMLFDSKRFMVHRDEIVIVQGGALGADRMAARAAKALGLHCAQVDALWGSYGGSAGPRRNRAMLALKPDLVIAFPGGPGTANCVGQARALGIPVEEVNE